MADIRLTGALISQARVIAKGRRIRDVHQLVTTYGGRVAGWSKRSSPAVRVGEHLVEYHWYEHPEIGRVEVKSKRVNPS